MKRLLCLCLRIVFAYGLLLALMLPAWAALPGPGPQPPPEPPIGKPGQDPFDLPHDTIRASEPIGYLPTSSSVTHTGQYTLSVPFKLPSGRGGGTPGLSFVYNSGGGNGFLGVGGSLSGFSEITRCGQTYGIDVTTSAADFSEDSRV